MDEKLPTQSSQEQSSSTGGYAGGARRPDYRSSSSGAPSGPGGYRRKPYMLRKKECQFCKNKVKDVDYKNFDLIRKFMSERGKILSSKITGTCYVHQIQLARAIKWGRFLALLPYTTVKYEA